MQSSFSSTFVRYFKGKQVVVAASDSPILMVYGQGTTQTHRGNVRDDAVYRITVEIRLNVKKYFDMANGNTDKLDALEALVDLVEERETDGDLKPVTVMGILNANLTISGTVLYTKDMEVEYEQYMNRQDAPEVRALVRFTAHDRPNRT